MSLIWKHCLFLNSFLRRQKTDVAASSDRSLNALLEGEEQAEWMYPPGQAPIATSPFCLQCEICPEAAVCPASSEYLPTGPNLPLLIITGI